MLNKPKLAMIVPELLPVPPCEGGAIEYWVHEVSQYLAQDYDVTVFSRPSTEAGYAEIKYRSVPWTKLERFFYQVKNNFSWQHPLRAVAKIQNVMSYGSRLGQSVVGFDVVIVHNEPNFLNFLSAEQNRHIVLYMHNSHLAQWPMRWFYSTQLEKVDRIICVSEYVKSQSKRFYPDHAHKFEVVYSATDAEKFKPGQHEARKRLNNFIPLDGDLTYLLYVGKLAENKGFHVLLEAFATLSKTNPKLRLLVAEVSFFTSAAKTSYQRKLVDLALPVQDKLIFTGSLPQAILTDLYTASDIVAIPSVSQDSCRLVVLEAMSSGTCLIASKTGEIPELVEHMQNGLLVEPGDVDALIEQLDYVLKNPEHKLKMQLAAREKVVREYTWTHLSRKMITSLDDTMEAAKYRRRIGVQL